jgi:hypothetical protein
VYVCALCLVNSTFCCMSLVSDLHMQDLHMILYACQGCYCQPGAKVAHRGTCNVARGARLPNNILGHQHSELLGDHSLRELAATRV